MHSRMSARTPPVVGKDSPRIAARLDEVAVDRALEHEAGRARLDDFEQVLLVVVLDSISARSAGRRCVSSRGACSPVLRGIEMSRIARCTSSAGPRRAASLEDPLRVEHGPQPLEDDRVIVATRIRVSRGTLMRSCSVPGWTGGTSSHDPGRP
jgi:hypothetical protein